ncbi:MAG TPA: NUDIX domain-containing protein [Tepidisphaeraceae bacterium]|nr:NUDIX domain-containing protein [Tepidisphaeraceae bacterium]
MPTIRTSPRAIIRRDNRYLVVRYQDSAGHWFVFPGGGQKHNEDLHQALLREVEEEIGVVPTIGRLRFVRECIADRIPESNLSPGFHQLEIFFDCTIPDGPVVSGPAPDPNQLGVDWMTTNELREIRFYPQAIVHLLNDDRAQFVGAYR